MFSCTYNYMYKDKEFKKVFMNANQYLGMLSVGIMLIASVYGIIISFREKKNVLAIVLFSLLGVLIMTLLISSIVDIIKNLKLYKSSLGTSQMLEFQKDILHYNFGGDEFTVPTKYIKKIKKNKYFYVFELDSEEIDKSLINPQIPHRSVRLPDLVLLANSLDVNLEF